MLNNLSARFKRCGHGTRYLAVSYMYGLLTDVSILHGWKYTHKDAWYPSIKILFQFQYHSGDHYSM